MNREGEGGDVRNFRLLGKGERTIGGGVTLSRPCLVFISKTNGGEREIKKRRNEREIGKGKPPHTA